MSFLICEKHGKAEKSGSNVMTSAQFCMDRECSQSYKALCQVCKKDHRNHAIKLLSFEDVSFLLQRMLKLPFKCMVKPIGQALTIINQLKLIKEFRKKIEILESEIQKQSIELIDQTQLLMLEYNLCKENATNLSAMFNDIDETNTYKELLNKSTQLLSGLDYNVKRDRLEYGNPFLKETQEKRSRTAQSAKEKIEEVRDYSLKIVEVILNNYESDDEGEDLEDKHKHYEALKEQLCLEKWQEAQSGVKNIGESCSTSDISHLKKDNAQKEIQTQHQLFTREQIEVQIQQKLTQLKQTHLKSETEFKIKLQTLSKQKENLHLELAKWKQKFAQKQKSIRQIETQMRGNRSNRNEKLKVREDLVTNIIQIWSTKGTDSQDSHL